MTTVETERDPYVSWAEFLRQIPLPALALISLAVWLHAADALLVATMLPAMVAELGGARLVAWSVSLYDIASLVAGACSALLTMRRGLRQPMAMAAGLFGLGCLISAVAASMPGVLAGRVLQGLGGGGLVAMAFVAVGVLIPARHAARCLAVVSAFWGASAFLGPLIGGFFVEVATWRWGFVFFAAKAFGLALWIGLRPNPLTANPSAEGRFPLRRLGLLCAAVLCISFGGVEVTALRTPALLALGLAALAVFLRLDGRAGADRLLPHAPLNLRQPVGAALAWVMSLSVATVAFTAYGPLLVIAIHGSSPLAAGYVLACSSIGWSIAAILVSGSPERRDGRMIALGVTLVTTGLIGFVITVPSGPVWLIALCATLEGAGFGTAWTFVLRQATKHAPPGDVQRVSGAIPTLGRLGYALGAAFVGIIANRAGFATMSGPEEAARIARIVFLVSLPFAGIALIALCGLRRAQPTQGTSA